MDFFLNGIFECRYKKIPAKVFEGRVPALLTSCHENVGREKIENGSTFGPFVTSQRIYSCNEGNFDSWDDEIKHAVTGFKTASSPWTQRYVGSMVSDIHRTLLYGGLFLYPADKKSPTGKKITSVTIFRVQSKTKPSHLRKHPRAFGSEV